MPGSKRGKKRYARKKSGLKIAKKNSVRKTSGSSKKMIGSKISNKKNSPRKKSITQKKIAGSKIGKKISSGRKSVGQKKMIGSKTSNKKNSSRRKSVGQKKMIGSKTSNKKNSARETSGSSKKMIGSKTSNKKNSTRRNSGSSKKMSGSKTSNKKIKWKAIPGFTKYEASTDGEIRNCFTEKVLSPNLVGGYYEVGLSGDGELIKYKVHRLVALTYINNPNDYDKVDHIDNDKLNNNVENLRWCTSKQNSEFYVRDHKKFRKILQFHTSGKLIKIWNSMTELTKNTKYYSSYIYQAMRKNDGNCYGYIWKCDPPIIHDDRSPDKNEKFYRIPKFENFDLSEYGASKNGNIINISKNRTMHTFIDNNGYVVVCITCKNKRKTRQFLVHRIVAYTFIENDDIKNKIFVNHKDKNRSNNHYLNLEWVTVQENNVQGRGKMVKMIDRDTNEILKIFRCVFDACRFLGFIVCNAIGQVCNGKRKSAYGYKWEWIYPDDVIDMPFEKVKFVPPKKKKGTSKDIFQNEDIFNAEDLDLDKIDNYDIYN